MHEFLRNLAGTARVARGRCLPYGDGITFWPLLEAIREAVGDEDGESPAHSLARQVITGLAEGSAGAEDGFAAVQALFEALARSQEQ